MSYDPPLTPPPLQTSAAKRDPTRLLYWYGTEWENRGEAYSFAQKSMVKSLDAGIKQGLDQLPKSILRKQEKGKKLSLLEEFHIRALEQFRRDRDLPPEDRIAWMMDFREECGEVESLPEEYDVHPIDTSAEEEIPMGVLNREEESSENDAQSSPATPPNPAPKKCMLKKANLIAKK